MVMQCSVGASGGVSEVVHGWWWQEWMDWIFPRHRGKLLPPRSLNDLPESGRAGFYGTKADWLMRHRGSNQTCERNQGPRPETHEPQRQTETQGQPADNVKLLANKQSACFQTCQDMLFLWCENCEFCCLQLVRSLWETNNPLCVLAACISVSLQRHNRPNISCVTCCVTVRCASRYNTGVLPWIA